MRVSRLGFVRARAALPLVGALLAMSMAMSMAATGGPAGAATAPVGNPIGHLDSMRPAGSGLAVSVAGWAIDGDTTAPISVDLYLDGQWNQRTTADVARPDVGQVFPASGPDHGFAADLVVPYVGNHVVCAYAINVMAGTTNPFIGCQALYVNRDPMGNLDSVSVSTAPAHPVTVAGWAIDPDTTGPISVDIYFRPTLVIPVSTSSGTASVTPPRSIRVTASLDRPDIGAAFPLAGPDHGFSATVTVPSGDWTVCAYGINVDPPGLNPQLGHCMLVKV